MAKVSTSRSGSFVVINVSGLRGFSTALRRARPEISRELRLGLRRAGDLVKEEARARAATGDMPASIADSLRVRTYGVRVSVIAGSTKATAAAAFEHKGVPGNFRHPLFGNRAYWYEQRAHPYLRPAAEMLAPKVADEVLDAVGAAIDKALAGELAT
jgi:hypothetical protein